MKKTLTITILLFCSYSFGQNLKVINHRLNDAFKRINYWAFNKRNTGDELVNSYDSLQKANDYFEKMLLKFTAGNPQTLDFNFKDLIDSGLIIATSEDNLFRIYTWDTQTGGTMHRFRNIFQYKNGDKAFSKINRLKNTNEEESDPGCSYYEVNDIISVLKIKTKVL